MRLDRAEVARSLELYRLQKHLKERAALDEIVLEFTREPFLRERSEVGKVVVAFGSYDPLSKAHEALFLRGLEAVQDDQARSDLAELLIVTSIVHFEKEVNLQKNSALYDRIHAQEGFASCYNNVALAFFNDPYFVNLIPALERRYGPDVSLYFVVGTDVMEKIVDPEGYRSRGFDPDEIIPKLFKHNFIVSERSITQSDGTTVLVSLEDLKARFPILQQFQDHLKAIDLRGDYHHLEIPIQEVSSTLIRKKRNAHCNTANLEAVGISDFVDRRDIYLQNQADYAAFCYARQRVVDEHPGQPIATYLDELMSHLRKLNRSPGLRAEEIENYSGPKRKRLLVINPPNNPYSDRSLLIEPIDALTIATYVRSLGNEVRFIDMDAQRMPPEAIEAVVKEFHPDITIMGFDYLIPLYRSSALPGLNKIAAIAKSHGSKVIVGGRRSKHTPEWFLDGNIDVAIGSEMEQPLQHLIQLEYWFPETLRRVNGISYRTKKTGFKTTSPRETRIEVNDLPFPDRSLVSLPNYIDVRTMWTSRGCNGHCSFCGTPDFWSTWKARSPERVVAEIEYLVTEFGAKKILFLDDNALVSKKRIIEISQGLIERGIETTLGCLSRVSSYDPAVMERMYQAGFRWIHYGAESGDDRVLRKNRKGITTEQIRNAVLGSKQLGFRVRTSWIFDLPGVDEQALRNTADLILETQPHEIRAHYLALREGTELYRLLAETGREKPSQYIHNGVPVSRTADFSADQILEGVQRLNAALELAGYLIVQDSAQLSSPGIVNDPRVKFISFGPSRYGIGWQR